MILTVVSTVHTSGVNWESVGVIGGFIVAAMTFLYGLSERRNTSIKDDITTAVTHLEETLTAKLETKDAVADLRISTAQSLASLQSEVAIMKATLVTTPQRGVS